MTIEREPLSIEDTLMEVIGQLKMHRVIELTGHSKGYVYALTHPEQREQLCVRDLEILDLAHHETFGRGFPIYEALGRRLETSRAERFADAVAIGRHGASLARENGEAITALLEASLTPGDTRLTQEALRQTEDVAREANATIASLRTVLGRSTGPPDTS